MATYKVVPFIGRSQAVDIEVIPGCLASLFGAKVGYTRFDQVVFRKA